jgi:hypothetical protein
MLTLTGTIRAVQQLGGGINKKTGEVVPVRQVVQVEGQDARGLFQMFTLTVPDPKLYADKIGKQIAVPVRACAMNATVNLAFDDSKQ